MGFTGTAAASLHVKIGADLKEFNDGMKSLGTELDKTGKTFSNIGGSLTKNVTAPILGVGAAMGALAISTGNYADRIMDLKAITGMSTDAIQEWQHVTRAAGVETEAVTSASERLNREMTSMIEGVGKGSEALQALGISGSQLASLDSDARMDLLITSLAAVEDGAERARIGSDLFGRQWASIAPIVDLGTEALAEARQQAYDMGTVLDGDALNSANNFRIELELLKAEFAALGRELAADIIPLFTDTIIPLFKETVMPIIKGMADAVKGLLETFAGLPAPVQKGIIVFVGFLAALGPVLMALGNMMTFISSLIKLKGALTLVAGKLAVAFAALNIPLLPFIAILAAVVAVGVLVIKNWEKIKQSAKNLVDALKMLNPFRKVTEDISSNLKDASEAADVNLDSSTTIDTNYDYDYDIPDPADYPSSGSGGIGSLEPGQLSMIIADDRVLKQLSRQLGDVGYSEQARGAAR